MLSVLYNNLNQPIIHTLLWAVYGARAKDILYIYKLFFSFSSTIVFKLH